MILKLIFVCVIIYMFAQCYGKSPFRSCDENKPCDQDFYCSTGVMFCSPCKDLCVEGFMDHCQHYCPGYAKNSKFAKLRRLSTTSFIINEALRFSENQRPMVESGILSTTQATKYISAKTGGTYEGNKKLQSEQDSLEVQNVGIILVIASAIIVVCLFPAVYICKRCGSKTREYSDQNSYYPDILTNGQMIHWSKWTNNSCSICSQREITEVNVPLKNDTNHCSVSAGAECNCKRKS